MTEPENAPLPPPEDEPPRSVASSTRQEDEVNGPSSTTGIGTGLGIGCLVQIVLLVVFGFVARSAGWL